MVSTANGGRTPCKWLQLGVRGPGGKLVERVSIAMNIPASGSGADILGLCTFEWLERVAPGSVVRLDRPLATSIRHITGIGGHNPVLFWPSVTLDFGGCPIVFQDLAVLPNHNGILLGNDTFKQGNACFSYHEHRTPTGVLCDGTIWMRDEALEAISEPVPFSVTKQSTAACFVSTSTGSAGEPDSPTAVSLAMPQSVAESVLSRLPPAPCK